MADSIILLCPGQGAQHVEMGKAWHAASEAARAVFTQADDVLGIALMKLCFEGPEDELNRTDVAQAALYTASVASWRGLLEAGVYTEDQVVATAGLSLGEFTALHLAGALDFETGLRLVRLRGQAMQDAADAVEGGSSMVALVGAEPEQADELCEKAKGDDVLAPANYNCPGQIVISGSQAACDRAVELAGQVGVKATALSVAGAFHSPLMLPAAERLGAAIADATWAAPKVTVMANVTAEPHPDDAASIGQRLVDQLTHATRWSQCMSWLLANQPGQFVELAPGKVLSGLMRRIDRKTKVANHAQP